MSAVKSDEIIADVKLPKVFPPIQKQVLQKLRKRFLHFEFRTGLMAIASPLFENCNS